MPKPDNFAGDPIGDAKAHLDEAMSRLTLECYRAPADRPLDERIDWKPVDDFTIAEELERIDRALGPKGKSMFADLADRVRSAYVEIKAARQALGA
jgi:hypothetical protein